VAAINPQSMKPAELMRVLNTAGPGKKLAGLMACTVIRPDDMADSILDRQKHPQWRGERTKMVYSFPGKEKLWARHNELMLNKLRTGILFRPVGDGAYKADRPRGNVELAHDSRRESFFLRRGIFCKRPLDMSEFAANFRVVPGGSC